MLLLDTNILSAMMSREWIAGLAEWFVRQPSEAIFTASVCQAEVLSGIEIMPIGRRRQELEFAARTMFSEDFDGKILPFDSAAAVAYADIMAMRKRSGRPIAPLDLMIAATARANGASVVTRDTGGFEGCGLTVINPWQAERP